jgi:hypothetical protein
VLSGEIGLPNGSANEITFYFSLPIDDYTLREAAKALTAPGTGSYRHYFRSYADAARTYGAKPSVIEAAVKSVRARGLSVMVDPSRTFVRVWATADQWKKVLGQPLAEQKPTPSSPFAVYDFRSVPKFDKLAYIGGGAAVYDTAIDTDGASGYGATVQEAAAIDRARAADNRGSPPATQGSMADQRGNPARRPLLRLPPAENRRPDRRRHQRTDPQQQRRDRTRSADGRRLRAGQHDPAHRGDERARFTARRDLPHARQSARLPRLRIDLLRPVCRPGVTGDPRHHSGSRRSHHPRRHRRLVGVRRSRRLGLHDVRKHGQRNIPGVHGLLDMGHRGGRHPLDLKLTQPAG